MEETGQKQVRYTGAWARWNTRRGRCAYSACGTMIEAGEKSFRQHVHLPTGGYIVRKWHFTCYFAQAGDYFDNTPYVPQVGGRKGGRKGLGLDPDQKRRRHTLEAGLFRVMAKKETAINNGVLDVLDPEHIYNIRMTDYIEELKSIGQLSPRVKEIIGEV